MSSLEEIQKLQEMLLIAQEVLMKVRDIAKGIEEDNRDFTRYWDYDIKEIYGMDKDEWDCYKKQIGKERLEKMKQLINLLPEMNKLLPPEEERDIRK